MGVTWES